MFPQSLLSLLVGQEDIFESSRLIDFVEAMRWVFAELRMAGAPNILICGTKELANKSWSTQ